MGWVTFVHCSVLFCELFYAHTKCFSSGPLVFAGPIFMNHREQALARLRTHPAQLKHKRDKHKGIWSSSQLGGMLSQLLPLIWILSLGKCTNLILLLCSYHCYVAWGERTCWKYTVCQWLSILFYCIFLLTLIKRRHFTMYLFLFHFFSNFLRLRKCGENNHGSLFYIFYYLLLDDCHLAFCKPFFFF